jgi:hypothetical protein
MNVPKRLALVAGAVLLIGATAAVTTWAVNGDGGGHQSVSIRAAAADEETTTPTTAPSSSTTSPTDTTVAGPVPTTRPASGGTGGPTSGTQPVTVTAAPQTQQTSPPATTVPPPPPPPCSVTLAGSTVSSANCPPGSTMIVNFFYTHPCTDDTPLTLPSGRVITGCPENLGNFTGPLGAYFSPPADTNCITVYVPSADVRVGSCE